MPDEDTLALRRQISRRSQLVRQRTRLKNEVHAVLAAHLIERCPATDLFGQKGRTWLSAQPLPMDERLGVEQRLRELDRLGEDLREIERALAQATIDDERLRKLLSVSGINTTVRSSSLLLLAVSCQMTVYTKLFTPSGAPVPIRGHRVGSGN